MEHKQDLAEGSLIRLDLIRSPVRSGMDERGIGNALCTKAYCAPEISHACAPWTLPTLLQVGMTIPRYCEWKVAQTGWVTCPRSHSQQEASLGCALCFWPQCPFLPNTPTCLSTSVWAGPQTSLGPSSILCDRSVWSLLAHCSDGELMAWFWLFMSVDLLS